MPRTPSRSARVLVESVKGLIVATVSFLAVAPSLTSSVSGDPSATAGLGTAVDVEQLEQLERVERLMTRHDCSATGFGVGVIPGSALIERDTRVKHVSFDVGWAVYTGAADGRLLAVCLAIV